VSLLLDTHVLLWWLSDDRSLAKATRVTIADPETVVYVSAVSAWEIGIKKALGKLSAPDDLGDQLRAGGFSELPITIADGLLAGALPRHHDDPFDRMLVAQAQRHGLAVVTRDPTFSTYGIAVLDA
jgi:PIN domain nuclease of toxin-antitoxin system